MQNEKTLRTAQTIITTLLIFLFPIFFVPNLFPNSFVTPKLILLVLGTLTLLFLQVLRFLVWEEIRIKLSYLDLPILLVVIATLVSTILKTPNSMDAWFLPATTSFILFGSLIYFLSNQLPLSTKSNLMIALISSATLAAFVAALHTLGILTSSSVETFASPSFSPLGGKLQAAIFLGIMSPITILYAIKQTDIAKKIFLSTLAVFILLGAFATISSILPKSGEQSGNQISVVLPPFQTSWVVAADAIKESPLLGTGPGNYTATFTRLKPRNYNSTPFWNVRFGSARSFYLTTLTETGLLGLLALALVILTFLNKQSRVLRSSAQDISLQKIASIGVIILLITLLFFPANPAIIFLLFILFSLSVSSSESKIGNIAISQLSDTGVQSSTTKTVPFIVLLAIGGASLFTVIKGTNMVRAENTYFKATQHLQSQDGLSGYNSLVTAIQKNPRIEKYHGLLAQTSLAIAQNTASKDPEQITDQDRAQVAQLVQQAINEGKSQVALNPQNAEYWLVLANIYRSVIPFAKGADEFALSTYTQAVALNPLNPNYRIDLGGVYYSLGMYEDAQRTFELAVLAKPDLANAHFNLAAALRQQNKIEQAIAQLEATLTLVKPDSSDFDLIKNELAETEKLRTSAAGQETQEPEPGELTIPQPVQEAPVDVELPEDASPPTAPEAANQQDISPTGSPIPTELP